MQSIMPNAFIHTNKSVFRTNTIATTTAAQEKEKEYKKQPKNLEDIDVCVCVWSACAEVVRDECEEVFEFSLSKTAKQQNDNSNKES